MFFGAVIQVRSLQLRRVRSSGRGNLLPTTDCDYSADRPRQSEGHALTSPHELALAYNRYVAALWPGEEAEARVFASWLAGYWVEEGPSEMADQPHAVSVLGGAGAGIRWYTRGGIIVGYVGSHVQGCFHVPIDAAPPPTQLGRQQT